MESITKRIVDMLVSRICIISLLLSLSLTEISFAKEKKNSKKTFLAQKNNKIKKAKIEKKAQAKLKKKQDKLIKKKAKARLKRIKKIQKEREKLAKKSRKPRKIKKSPQSKQAKAQVKLDKTRLKRIKQTQKKQERLEKKSKKIAQLSQIKKTKEQKKIAKKRKKQAIDNVQTRKDIANTRLIVGKERRRLNKIEKDIVFRERKLIRKENALEKEKIIFAKKKLKTNRKYPRQFTIEKLTKEKYRINIELIEINNELVYIKKQRVELDKKKMFFEKEKKDQKKIIDKTFLDKKIAILDKKKKILNDKKKILDGQKSSLIKNRKKLGQKKFLAKKAKIEKKEKKITKAKIKLLKKYNELGKNKTIITKKTKTVKNKLTLAKDNLQADIKGLNREEKRLKIKKLEIIKERTKLSKKKAITIKQVVLSNAEFKKKLAIIIQKEKKLEKKEQELAKEKRSFRDLDLKNSKKSQIKKKKESVKEIAKITKQEIILDKKLAQLKKKKIFLKKEKLSKKKLFKEKNKLKKEELKLRRDKNKLKQQKIVINRKSFLTKGPEKDSNKQKKLNTKKLKLKQEKISLIKQKKSSKSFTTRNFLQEKLAQEKEILSAKIVIIEQERENLEKDKADLREHRKFLALNNKPMNYHTRVAKEETAELYNRYVGDITYSPRIDWNYKVGNKRDLTRTELFLPLLQDKKNLVFADIRGWSDDDNTDEGNLGLGYRHLYNNKFVFGAYGFFDQRTTKNKNEFKQNTFGAELLTKKYDFRANYYLSGQDKKLITSAKHTSIYNTLGERFSNGEIAISSSEAILTEETVVNCIGVCVAGNNIYTKTENLDVTVAETRTITRFGEQYSSDIYVNQQTGSLNNYEYSLDGFDLEAGANFTFLEDISFFKKSKFLKKAKPILEDIKILFAYYSFYNDDVNIDISGFRVRTEIDLLNNIEKNNKHKLFLEAELSNDNVRDNISFIGFKYSLNFGNSRKNRKLSKLEERMTEAVIRDIDIVTDTSQIKFVADDSAIISTDTGDDMVVALEDRPGSTIISTPVITTSVKDSSGNDVAAVQNNDTTVAGAVHNQRIIYVDSSVEESGIGTVERQYKTLQEAQNNSKAYDIIYVAYGNGDNYGGITLKDNQKIFGSATEVTLGDVLSDPIGNSSTDPNASIAIIAQGLGTTTTIDPNAGTDISGNVSKIGAVRFANNANNILIQGLEIIGGSTEAILAENKIGLAVKNNKITNSGYGVYISNDVAGAYEYDISNNYIAGHENSGVFINTTETGLDFDVTINTSGNTIIDNEQYGIVNRFKGTTGSVNLVTIENNIINSNFDSGILLEGQNNTISTFNVLNNTLNNNGNNSIALRANINAQTNGDIEGNTISYTLDSNDYLLNSSGATMYKLINVNTADIEANRNYVTITNALYFSVNNFSSNAILTYDVNSNTITMPTNYEPAGVSTSINAINSIIGPDFTATGTITLSTDGNNVVIGDVLIESGSIDNFDDATNDCSNGC